MASTPCSQILGGWAVEEGDFKLGLGRWAGEEAVRARWRKRALTWKLGAWGLRPFNGSAPK